jgi:ketosteroid isomerase-like protein
MTTNAARSTTLVRALHASIEPGAAFAQELYTDDVKAWSPGLFATSAAELATELERRDEAFSDVDLTVVPLDVGGDFAAAEWTVARTHSGRLVLADGVELEATGLRITVNGVTVAEFLDDRICALRQYWDELTVFEQLGLLAQD